MFSSKRNDGSEVVDEMRNTQVWESLIADLSEDTSFGVDADIKSNEKSSAIHKESSSTANNGVGNFAIHELASGRDERSSLTITSSHHSKDNGQSGVDATITAATSLKYPTSLRDWISFHAKKQPPTVNYLGKKMDREYTLSAAKLALSLSKKLAKQFQRQSVRFIHCKDITADKVLVNNSEGEDAEFSLEIGIDDQELSSDCSNSERLQILAFGLVLYELFTQGKPPPSRFLQPFQSSRKLSFVSSLKISDNERGDGVDDREASSSRRQRRRCDEGKERSVATTLQLEGVPISLCRLISDMLSNRDDTDFGSLFQYDKSVSCFTDVILDLTQMNSNPVDFLWDTIRLSAKPTIRNKLYCREKELERGLMLADRVTDYLDGGMNVEEDEMRTQEAPAIKQEVLLITGHAGSGKSSLVRELINRLAERGWDYLHCKFDHVARRKPLSTIASAFDTLLSSLVTSEKTRERFTIDSIRSNILQSLDEESLSILFHFMPNLKCIIANDCNQQHQQIDYMFDACDTIASKCRMHNLFFVLLMSISQNTPVLLSLDDLHWADTASLELITFLVDELGASIAEDAQSAKSTNVFIIATFRSNEVDHSKGLQQCLLRLQDCLNVTVTNLTVEDLSSADVNFMISEALCYSHRLTSTLADIVHQKTTGNPFFVKEFLNDLTVENLLVYSFSKRTWEWNEDLIESRTISDGVAEILIRKLLRLPKDQLLGLTMLSCFGSEVSLEVLNLVKHSCGNMDVMQSLESVAQAGLVKRTDTKYFFVHDMILNAARETLDESQQIVMQKKLLQTLVAKTSGYCDDAILFIIVDLISRIGTDRINDKESRLLYSNLNLTAATKAVQASDFASASTCIECGLSLLDPDHWNHSYRLSLDLYTLSALVEWSQGNTERMKKSLEEVFQNAKTFDDKLRAAEIKLDYQGMIGTKGAEANAFGFHVLEQLGESFPSSPENEIIVQELLDTKNRLSGLNKSSLKNLPIMSDSKKIQTMTFLESMLMRCYQYQSKYMSLVACRMVRITLQYGSSKSSSVGFACTALSFVTVFGDFGLGLNLARMSLNLLDIHNNRLLPDVYAYAYGAVMLWKDPIQSVLPHLLDGYRIAEKSGYVGTAGHACAMFYSYRAFFSGSQLTSLGKEVSLFLRKSERDKRKVMTLSFLPISKGIAYIGRNTSPHAQDFIVEEDLDEVVNNHELAVCECFLVVKLCCDVIFRRFDALKTIARKYVECIGRRGNGITQYVNIHRHFYGGLVSFHFFRENCDEFWLDRASDAISKFETWAGVSRWNFENKLNLLQAEHHYSFGEIEDAALKYRLAIELSQKHRFVHEEALACEHAAEFHMKIGNKDVADELMTRAIQCYETWGADKKVVALREMMKGGVLGGED